MKLIWHIKLCSQIMHCLDRTDMCAQQLAQKCQINVRVLFFQAMLAGDEQSGIDMNVNYGWTRQLFHYTVAHQLV